MKSVPTLLIATSLPFALAACSLFGIATKGDLEDHREATGAQSRAVQRNVESMRSQLDRVRSELEEANAALAGRHDDLQGGMVQLRENQREVESILQSAKSRLSAVTEQLQQMESTLAADVASV